MRWLEWALAAPFVFVFGGPGLALLAIVSFGYLAVASVLDLPLLYVMATFAGVAGATGFGAVARILWPHGDADSGSLGLTAVGSSPRKPDRPVWWWTSVTALCAMIAVTSWGLEHVFSTAAENHPAGTFVALALGGLAGYAIVIAVDGAAGHGLSLFPSFRVVTIAPAIVIGASAFVGALGGWNDRMQKRAVVTDYCSYGSVSSAQMEGCLSHVTIEQGRSARHERSPVRSRFAQYVPV